LINKEQLTLDVATDIADAIDEAFEKREYGFEARAGYLQELVHKDSDAAKVGRIYAYAQYEKPLSLKHQYTTRSDFFYSFTDGSGEEKAISGTELLIKNYISSVWGSNWESVVGVDLIYKSNLSDYYTEQMQMRGQDTSECDLISNYYYYFSYPEGISAKLYGKLKYEITDTLTWENGISYIFIEPYDSSYDTQEYFNVYSTLSYEIW
jgi:hypothetical protein